MAPTAREIAGDNYILWGASWSLYTAKVRPYLIKKGIDYVEINPSHPHFNDTIMKTVGYFTVPVLETPEGKIIADSAEIMEFLEPKFPVPPMLPENKPLAALAYLIHSFGSEGLTKSAMYLRWNTSYENRLFARSEFGRTLASPEQADAFAIAMRGYLPILGITLDHGVDVAMEESIAKLYEALNAHFLKYPYILGGVPSLADYGLMGPLYAHHGRDIASSDAVKKHAPAVYRWIETMLRPPIVDPEVWHVPQEYFSVDDLPDTLMSFLKLVGENYVPEIQATIDLYHEWLDAQERAAGAVVDVEGEKRCHQVLGQLEHVQMGSLSLPAVSSLEPSPTLAAQRKAPPPPRRGRCPTTLNRSRHLGTCRGRLLTDGQSQLSVPRSCRPAGDPTRLFGLNGGPLGPTYGSLPRSSIWEARGRWQQQVSAS